MKSKNFIVYGIQKIPFGRVSFTTSKPLLLFNEVGESLGLVNGQTVSEEMYNKALDTNIIYGRAFCSNKLTPQRIDQ